jgi:hypothetical protein
VGPAAVVVVSGNFPKEWPPDRTPRLQDDGGVMARSAFREPSERPMPFGVSDGPLWLDTMP